MTEGFGTSSEVFRLERQQYIGLLAAILRVGGAGMNDAVIEATRIMWIIEAMERNSGKKS